MVRYHFLQTFNVYARQSGTFWNILQKIVVFANIYQFPSEPSKKPLYLSERGWTSWKTWNMLEIISGVGGKTKQCREDIGLECEAGTIWFWGSRWKYLVLSVRWNHLNLSVQLDPTWSWSVRSSDWGRGSGTILTLRSEPQVLCVRLEPPGPESGAMEPSDSVSDARTIWVWICSYKFWFWAETGTIYSLTRHWTYLNLRLWMEPWLWVGGWNHLVLSIRNHLVQSVSPEQEPSGPSLFRNCLVMVLMWGSNQMSLSVQMEPSGYTAEAGTIWQ